MVEQDIPGAAASHGTPTSTPAHRAAGRLQQVLPPGYEVWVEDIAVDSDADPDSAPGRIRRCEPVIRVLAAADRARD